VIAINPKLPVNNLKELIAYAKANPGKLNFASSGNGSIQHMRASCSSSSPAPSSPTSPTGARARSAGPDGGQVDIFITTPAGVVSQIQGAA
jgi:tripartite-type tricarboxylate transporter receptor subunit TctC